MIKQRKIELLAPAKNLECGIEAVNHGADAEAQQVGIEWCVQQCKELIAHGVPSLHFYSVGATDSIREVAKQIY